MEAVEAIEQQLSLSENDLLTQLGGELVGPQVLPMRSGELAERAKRWMDAQRETLEEQICNSESIKQFTLATSDNAAIALELTKLLAGIVLPVNPVTLAVLLVKKGLSGFCSTRWKEENDR